MARRFGISLVAVTVALLATVPAAAAEPEPQEATSQAEIIAGLILQLEGNLAAVDATIDRHETRLDELYDLRDAAADDADAISLYDGMIDRLTLVLDETERLREDLAANIASARRSLAALQERQSSSGSP